MGKIVDRIFTILLILLLISIQTMICWRYLLEYRQYDQSMTDISAEVAGIEGSFDAMSVWNSTARPLYMFFSIFIMGPLIMGIVRLSYSRELYLAIPFYILAGLTVFCGALFFAANYSDWFSAIQQTSDWR